MPEDIRNDPAKLRTYVKKLNEEDAAIARSFDYEGIPIDAEGVPTYFRLSPGMRVNYEQRLAGIERAWNATKDPAFAREANAWAAIHRQPHPSWLNEANDTMVAELRAGSSKYDNNFKDNQAHFIRYEQVRDRLKERYILHWDSSHRHPR